MTGHHGNIFVIPTLWDQKHNLTSVHDGEHSNYIIHYAPSGFRICKISVRNFCGISLSTGLSNH